MMEPSATTGLNAAQAQQLFLDALESSGDTAWRLDFRTGLVELAGRSLKTMFGINAEIARIPLAEWKQRLHPSSNLQCDQFIADLRENGHGETELTFVLESGKHITVSDRGRVIEADDAGEPVVAAGIYSDISKQKALENRFSQLAEYFDVAMEAADLATWRWNFTTNTAWLDGPLIRHVAVGDIGGEITGAEWCSFVHRDDLKEVLKQTGEMAEGKRASVDLMYRLRDTDGNWRWLQSFGRVTKSGTDGKALFATGILKDETENVRLRKQLESSKNYFEIILRNTPALFHQTDDRGILQDVSDHWLRFMGYERDEVIGRPSVDFLTEESRIYALTHALPEFFETGHIRNVAYQFRKKNGEIFDALVSAHLSVNPDTGEKRAFAVISDVTQLRRAYRDLQRSNRELDRFATVASHDLQEPLRKIRAFATMLKTRYSGSLDSDGQSCLEFLTDAAGRMQELIDRLLEYSQLEVRPLRSTKISLSEALGEIRKRLADAIAKSGARIALKGQDVIHADKFLLEQILQNLISNAIKYRSVKAPRITIDLSADESGFSLNVTDNGIGFDPKFAEQVFEPFRRLHPRGEFGGAGIGLAIVRQAVERQNGRIFVETRPGEGTTFSISLPRVEAARSVA
ncbi:sensor histidine kinase [Hyphobacterium sp.]|uniref:sensor histidine kinase n=1 Tax=Hyphobacterium sp. TaxID=2004662 RepID=UPI003B520B2A